MAQPRSYQDWFNVALERANDADAILGGRPSSVGPVYMAGYAIECALKGYLRRKGVAFPTSGSSGHDLRALWKQAGFQLRDLRDSRGHRAFFVNQWSTDMRYETSQGFDPSAKDLVKAARQLSKYIRTEARRRHRR